jgi:hypothetical protein
MQCLRCLKHFHESWTATRIGQDKDSQWEACVATCPECQRFVIALLQTGKMPSMPGQQPQRQISETSSTGGKVTFVYPKAMSRSPLSSEVPKEFAQDYLEACLVLADSEKASAALSRRSVQHLLREKAAGVKKGDLANEIQQVLDSKQLPTYLADDLDAIRNVGNLAAHPLKSTNTGEIVEVEPHEAEWLLNVLEGLFDFYFVQPAKSKARQNALNAKLKSAGKPPMKK